ncbi:MAG: LptF/LptG family permease [Lewinella sp.]|nr:LptF/LptG family permease [Lewinella sp.]
MLKTLDRYIIRKFLSTFFFTVLIFTLITVIIDFSEKVEDFIESDISRSEIWLQYYPTFVFFMYGMLFPLFTLIAVVFFTSRLANNSEILSILNAGVSFRRLLRPYLIAAVGIAAFHALASHYLVPAGNKIRLRIEQTYIDTNRDQGKTRNIHMFVSPDTKVYVNFWRRRDSTIRDFRLERFDSNQLVYLLKATSAEWQGPPDQWRLRNYEIRTFDGMHESLVLGEGKQLDTTINLTPNDFVDYKEQQSMMTTPELKAYINRQLERGVGNTAKYEAELYRRTAEPVTVLILTLIGVAVAGRKVRGGLGLHLALGIFIGAIFLILSRFSAVFAAGQALPILLSVWLPNIIFGGVAVYFIRRAQK